MPTRTKPDWIARAGLALLVLALFREPLLGGVLFRRDVHLIWVPQVEGFVRAVAEGALPLWDPSPAFGQPLLADPQAQVLYPPTWLNLLLRPWVYYTLYTLGHLLFSVLSMRALGRCWGLSRLASASAACAWGLSGPLLSLVDNSHHLAGATYVPGVFFALELALARRRSRDVVVLGLVTGLQILAGSADMCALTLLAAAAWVAIAHVRWRDWRSAASVVSRGAAALLLAAAIGAGVWTAALGAVLRSSRHALPEEVRTYWSLHPAGLLETVLVGIPGSLPLSPGARRALVEGREPFLASLYLGLPALGLVGAAFVPAGDRRRWALATLGIAALAVSLGRHAPFYDLLTTLLPPLRLLRYPVKVMLIASFAWAALVGFGVDAWRARARVGEGVAFPRRRWIACVLLPLGLAGACAAALAAVLLVEPALLARWAGAFLMPPAPGLLRPLARSLALHAALAGAVLALASLFRQARASRVAAAAAIVALVDLAIAHPRPNPVAPRALYTHRPEVLAAIGDLSAARVYSYDYADRARPADVPGPEVVQRLARVPAGWSPEAALALAQQLSLAPQTAGRWRLRQAFDVDYKGLQSEPLAYLTRLAHLREDRPDELVRLLRLCAVTHVIAQHRVAGDKLRLIAEVPGLFAAPTLVLAVPDPMPRARAVAGVRVADGLEALDLLDDPGFDAERTIILPAGRPVDAPASFRGQARILSEKADRVRIEAELSAPGYVVLADTHDPGWRVRVDGRKAALLRANLAQRAVAVPAGRHLVEMVYRPPLVLAAAALSLAALLASLASLVRLG